MKILGITHRKELAIGFRLCGIEVIHLEQKEDIIRCIEEIKNRKDVGILVITDTIYNMLKQEIDNIRENVKLPLIVQIPNVERSL